MFRDAILTARRETERMCAAPQPPERTTHRHRSAATLSATDPRARGCAAALLKMENNRQSMKAMQRSRRLDDADDAMTYKFATG